MLIFRTPTFISDSKVLTSCSTQFRFRVVALVHHIICVKAAVAKRSKLTLMPQAAETTGLACDITN